MGADFKAMTDAEFEEFDHYAGESYAETILQYRSEVAMFGDAGQGQGIDAGLCHQGLKDLVVERNRRNPVKYNFPIGPEAPRYDDDAEIPF